MASFNRRSTPKVVDGRVQKKNRHEPTATYWTENPIVPEIDKERPGRGFRHLLSKRDILDFIDIIPNWSTHAEGLAAVLLAEKQIGWDGWYNYADPDVGGIIGICAWTKDIWRTSDKRFYFQHRRLFKRLGVPCEAHGEDVLCKFTEDTARAYQLLHIFLHELGHHHDRMTSKQKQATGRGEHYAEGWAFERERILWDAYQQKFGLV